MNNGSDKNDEMFGSIGPHCLLFDSFFECGNLEKAEYVTPTEYNLYLNVDTNTKGHQQWFYFKVKNTFKDKKYKFHIRNFTKPFSLYRQGMKIMMKSKKQEEESEQKLGWVPAGERLCYWKTDIQRSGWRIPGPLNLDDEEDDDQILDDINGIDGGAALNQVDSKKISNITGKARPSLANPILQTNNNQNFKRRKRYFYSLTFQVEFDYDDDIVYFAYSTPYPYSKIYCEMLQIEQQLIDKEQEIRHAIKITESVDKLERQISTKDIQYDRKLLCRSISGLPVPIITMTSRRHKGIDFKRRQAICISARVHPGETNSNQVYDGLINYLVSSEGSKELLQNFIFKLIPCLNPDGNVCGNYRSSLAGVDLNRQWILPNKELHPIVYHMKEMLSSVSKERQLLLYCDLHCHSKKKNSFIYGCNTAANGGFTSWTKVRLLPRIIARLCPLFNLKDCRFRIDPGKLGTARVIVWKEYSVTNSFTLENSFYGYSYGKDTIVFKPTDYQSIGENLGKALVQYRLLLKQIEKELALTNGWLKPKLLLEVTGTPAAEKIATDQEKLLKEEKKRKQIEEYRQNLGLTEHFSETHEISLIKSQQNSDEKTRNVYRAKTMGQQGIASGGKIVENILVKQTTNQSDSNVQKTLKLKKNSSSESTKLDTNRRVTSQTATSFEDNKQANKLKNQVKKQEQNDLQINSNLTLIENQTTENNNISEDQTKTIKLQKFIKSYLNTKNDNELTDEAEQILKDQIDQEQINESSQYFPDISMKDNQFNNAGSKTNPNITPKNKKKIYNSNIQTQEHSPLKRQRSKSLIIDDWRQLFNKTELDVAFDQINLGVDPNEQEKQLSDEEGSESNVSEDNLEIKELYKEIYMRDHLMEKEIKQLKKAEDVVRKDLQKLFEEDKILQDPPPIIEKYDKSPEIKVQDQKEVNVFELKNGINIVSASFNIAQTQIQHYSNKLAQKQKNQSDIYSQNDLTQNLQANNQINTQKRSYNKQAQASEYDSIPKKSMNALQQNSRRPSSQLGTVNNCPPELGVVSFDRIIAGLEEYQSHKEQYSFVNQFQYKPQNHSLNNKSRIYNQKQMDKNPYQTGAKIKPQQQYFNSFKDNQQSRQNNKSILSHQSNADSQNHSGFQQYIMKNLRYEDPKVQQAYSKIKTHTNNNSVAAALDTSQNLNQQSNDEIIPRSDSQKISMINKRIRGPQQQLQSHQIQQQAFLDSKNMNKTTIGASSTSNAQTLNHKIKIQDPYQNTSLHDQAFGILSHSNIIGQDVSHSQPQTRHNNKFQLPTLKQSHIQQQASFILHKESKKQTIKQVIIQTTADMVEDFEKQPIGSSIGGVRRDIQHIGNQLISHANLNPNGGSNKRKNHFSNLNTVSQSYFDRPTSNRHYKLPKY